MPPRGPFIPIPLTWEVIVRGLQTSISRPIVMVWHAQASASPSPTDASNIANAFNYWLVSIVGATPSDVSWESVTAIDLNSASGPMFTVSSTHAGTNTPSYPGACMVIETHSVHRGRRFNGRHFMPLAQADTDIPTATVHTTARDFQVAHLVTLDTALNALTPASGIQIASRKLHTSVAASSFAVRPELARIRRRQLG